MGLATGREEMTAREREEFEQEKEAARIQSEYNLTLKDKELELAQLEAKWSSWMKIPITIIKLPVLVVFGLAYMIAMARKFEPSDDFWKFIQR